MRENDLTLAPSSVAAVAAIPMPVRSSLMPRTSCGAPMAFGCPRWTTAGAGSSPQSSIGTPSVSAGMSACAATATPCSQAPWGLPVCITRPQAKNAARGQAERTGSPLPVSGWTTSPTRSSSGATKGVQWLRRRALRPDGVAEPFNRMFERTDHPWLHLPQHRGAARRRRPGVGSNASNAQWIIENLPAN